MTEPNVNRAGARGVLLAYLAAPRKDRASEAKALAALAALPTRYSRGELRQQLVAARGQLEAAGLVEGWTLTSAGRDEMRAWLGPPPPRQAWPRLKQRLYASHLGLDPKDVKVRGVLATKEGRQAAELAQAFSLPSGLSLRRTLDALVWRALGIASTENIGSNRLRARVLEREAELPAPTSRQAPAKECDQAVRTFIARRAGAASKGDPLGHGVAALLQAEPGPTRALPPEPARRAPTPAAVTVRNADLPAFAARALTAAALPTTHRYGPELAFLSSVRQAMGEPRPTFEQRMASAHRAGLLTMARADLVADMDPELVRASELRMGAAEFHFLRVGETGRRT
ncbi:MAG: hypothetical protein AAGH15_15495 [Myxococcota bacterium]